MENELRQDGNGGTKKEERGSSTGNQGLSTGNQGVKRPVTATDSKLNWYVKAKVIFFLIYL